MTATTNKSRRAAAVRLSGFARSLLEAWRQLELPKADATVVVAVSGGADSSALLLAVDELVTRGKLTIKPIVAHLDHGLRKDSQQHAQWVSGLSSQLGYPVVHGKRNLKSARKKAASNLEQTARKARYNFLEKTAKRHHSNFVLTAHTLDDQAETVLMRLLRGSAAEGLSGTMSVRPLSSSSDIKLVRPLVSWARRADTEDYCRLRKIDFRHDEMNDDEAFSRVRVRKQLMPLLESFNNRIVHTLSRTAVLLGEDALALSNEAKRLLELATGNGHKPETKVPSIDVLSLSQAPAAVRRRALREWILRARGNLRRIEMVHLLAVERLLEGERGGRVAELPGGMRVTRRRGRLELSVKKVEKRASRA